MFLKASLRLVTAAAHRNNALATATGLRLPQQRLFSASPIVRQQTPPQQQSSVADSSKTGSAPAVEAASAPPQGTHRVTAMDRKYLVWSGKYKSAADVPEYVHSEAMERANNRTRIRIANIMMLLTVVGCIAMVLSGKKAAESGDSVQKRNIDWHKQYNEPQEPKK